MSSLRRSSRRRRDQAFRATTLGSTAGFALGLAVMYFLDPQDGNRRRAVFRDKLFSFFRKSGVQLRRRATYTRDRARGLVAETRARFRHDDVDDFTLAERVRSAMGRAVSHPATIEVTAANGIVTLRGQVLEHELDDLLRKVSRVRGVEAIRDRLEVHREDTPSPSLQDGSGSF